MTLAAKFSLAVLFASGIPAVAAEPPLPAGQFLALPLDSRAAAMGGVGVFGGDAAAVFSNPAALAALRHKSLALGHSSYEGSLRHDHVAASRNFGKAGTAALGANFYSGGSFPPIGPTGVGRVSQRDYGIALGLGQFVPGRSPLAGYAWGAAGEYVSAERGPGARTFAANMGVLSPPLFEKRLTWGMSASHWGGALKYPGLTEELPRLYRLGAEWKPRPFWSALAEVSWRRQDTAAMAWGTEYQTPFWSKWTLFLRGGYGTQRAENRALSGFSAGLGIARGSFQWDYYARRSFSESTTQGMTVGFRFDRAGRLAPALQDIVNEAKALKETGQYPESVVKFNEALKLCPTCREIRQGLDDAYQLMIGR